jgi:hypothetical protein
MLAAVVLAVMLSACASSGTATTRSSGSPDKLSKAQLDESGAPSAYDAVVRLRPKWLSPPGLTMTGLQNSQTAQVVVYLDGIRMGGTDALRQINTSSVVSMEFLSPTRAATVVRDLGSGAAVSVIMVNTR